MDGHFTDIFLWGTVTEGKYEMMSSFENNLQKSETNDDESSKNPIITRFNINIFSMNSNTGDTIFLPTK